MARFYLLTAIIGIISTANATKLKKLRRGNNNNIDNTATTGSNNHHSQPQRKLAANMKFIESACNADLSLPWTTCTPIDTFLLTQQSPSDSEVKIPCGECVTMNTTNTNTNTVYDFPHGLNIVGKLHIPENASFIIRTKFVLVQGLLKMDAPIDTKLPRADGALIKIILTGGSENVQFYPNTTENTMACGMDSDSNPLPCKRLDITAIHEDCPSWTKLQSLSANRTQITLTDESAVACWAPGAELLFTSDEVSAPTDNQLATIHSVDSVSGIITLTSPLPKHLTSTEDSIASGDGALYGVEVAILTRRITFEPEDNTDLIGGHTIIFHTPDIAQNIQGVELRRFGQQGSVGRYPLHFHMSEFVDGTMVKKNLVRESNQRCMVIHGTHRVTLTENVAFDTFGHCFMTEDGGEWYNYFIRNLGVQAKVPTRLIKINGKPESDDQPTTFMMTTPVNHYIGNVAASSADFGFWLERMSPIRSPSSGLAINQGKNPQTLPLGTFDGNVAHSCTGHGISFYPDAYRPNKPATTKDTYSYKNGGFGFRIGGSINMILNGGVLSDNMRGGVDSSAGKTNQMISVLSMTIASVSIHLDNLIASGRAISRPCNTIGVSYATSKGNNWLMTYKDIDFRGFQSTTTPGCTMKAIQPSTQALQNGLPIAVNNPHIENVSFDSPTNRISVCRAVNANYGLRGFAIDDSFGSLSTNNTPGFFVQDKSLDPPTGLDYPSLTTFLPANSCAPIEDSCLVECPNSCFRQVRGYVPSTPLHNNKRMMVTANGVNQLVPRALFPGRELSLDHRPKAQFIVWLPYQPSYNITFVEDDGVTAAWPGFAKLSVYSAPNCQNDMSTNLVYPPPNDRCQNLVFNGNIELGTKDGWQGEFNTPFKVVTPGAVGTAHALKTTNINRKGNHGLLNYFDISCIRAWASEGKSIRFSGYFRTWNSNNADVASSVNLKLFAEDSMLKSVTLLSTSVATAGDGSWTYFEKIIVLPSSLVNAEVGKLIIEGAAKKYIVIDEMLIEEVIEPTNSPTNAPSLSPTLSPYNLAIAPGSAASQSTTCYSGVASRAIDGNTDGIWKRGSVQHTCNEPNAWWKVTLNPSLSHTINSVIIWNRSDSCCRDRIGSSEVQILDSSGEVIASQKLELRTEGYNRVHTFDFGSVVGSSVRVMKTVSGSLNIAEVQVMGQSRTLTR